MFFQPPPKAYEPRGGLLTNEPTRDTVVQTHKGQAISLAFVCLQSAPDNGDCKIRMKLRT